MQYIPIGIQDEGDVPHLAISETLFERNSEAFKARTRLLDVFHGNSNVAETSARVSVAVSVALEVGVGFRAVVVSELKDAW